MVSVSARCFVVFLALVLLPAGAWTADSGYLNKKNAIVLKPGYHFYPTNDFFDFRDIDRADLHGLMFEAAYERKLNRMFGLEFELGYFSSSKKYRKVLFANDSSDIEIENWYLSSSLKGYIPVSETNITRQKNSGHTPLLQRARQAPGGTGRPDQRPGFFVPRVLPWDLLFLWLQPSSCFLIAPAT